MFLQNCNEVGGRGITAWTDIMGVVSWQRIINQRPGLSRELFHLYSSIALIGIVILIVIIGERDTITGVQIGAGAVYVYKCVWRYACHNSSACHAYVMWAELHHCHFVYVPAVLNVTTGNGMGIKNVLKWNRALEFEFSIQSSVYGATTVAKVSLFSTWTRCTVSFYSM